MGDYIGSVKFYKNLILAGFVTAIIVPTCTSFIYKSKYKSALADNRRLQTQIASEEQQFAEEIKTALYPEGSPYKDLYPDFYSGVDITADTVKENTVYLTFDDGPSERTYEVLNALSERDVKATFFVVGKSDEYSKQAMRDIVAQGHTIAMHSYTHDYNKVYQSVEDYLDDMYKIFCLIKEATGVTPVYFRMAGGSINAYNYRINQEIISEMLRRGFIPCDWNVSSGDASRRGLTKEQVLNNVVTGATKYSRSVVLMHDSHYRNTTARAVPEIIRQLREAGYEFETLTPDIKPIVFSYSY